MTEEEKKAMIYFDETLTNKCDVEFWGRIRNLINKQQKEIKKYKRYFKLAISDLQSEGYMQMPYENIEEYYSKREDIV